MGVLINRQAKRARVQATFFYDSRGGVGPLSRSFTHHNREDVRNRRQGGGVKKT